MRKPRNINHLNNENIELSEIYIQQDEINESNYSTSNNRIRTLRSIRSDKPSTSPKLHPAIQFLEDQIDEVTTPKIPFFTILIITSIWVFYLYGIIFVIGWKKSNLRMSGPTSPPYEVYFFQEVSSWPSCSDLRSESWRLVSFQFVHQGLQHILGNTLAGILYGSFLENLHNYGFFFSLAVFELGVVYGAVGFSYVWPYSSLVGCSCGVYSMMGGITGLIIINQDQNYKLKWGIIAIVLTFELAVELILFFVSYNPIIGYSSHVCGFFLGLFFTLSVGCIKHKSVWKIVVGSIALCLLIAFTITIFYNYLYYWPPKIANWNPTFHTMYTPLSCCGQMYSIYAANHSLSLDTIRSSYVCNGDDIYMYGTDPNY